MENYQSILWNIKWKLSRRNAKKRIYLQFVDLIQMEFERGNVPFGLKMPAIRTLASVFKVKPHVVERAYAFLVSKDHVLYAVPGIGTFMHTPVMKDGHIKEVLFGKFKFNKTLGKSVEEDTKGVMNILTIGSVYQPPRSKTYEVFNDIHHQKDTIEVRTHGKYYFPEALKILKNRGIIDNEDQLCIIPRGFALYKVMRCLIKDGDDVVSVSEADLQFMELCRNLHLKVSITGADEKGMSADGLERICKEKDVKVVIIRPRPDFPVPVSMKKDRWKQIVALSVKFNFCLLVMDYDYEFCRSGAKDLQISLQTATVVYIAPLSNLTLQFHQIGMVAGPKDFISLLNKRVKKCYDGGDYLLERGMAGLCASGELSSYVRTVNKRCKAGEYSLDVIFKSYIADEAHLILPDWGTFAFVGLNAPLNPVSISALLDTELYHNEGNLWFNPDAPVNALRISLCIDRWNPVEIIFKGIRGGN
ncbi:hypothetical protein [Pedobacter gandavensis]|uniref:hypothetical protein n=1 Tax=Pedobacter gandavensis TaxID=2679963 RepID=UPI002931AB94|nr:hypothetical protein [Pedobacter gandavensis]